MRGHKVHLWDIEKGCLAEECEFSIYRRRR